MSGARAVPGHMPDIVKLFVQLKDYQENLMLRRLARLLTKEALLLHTFFW